MDSFLNPDDEEGSCLNYEVRFLEGFKGVAATESTLRVRINTSVQSAERN